MHVLSWGQYLPRARVRGRDASGALGLPPEVVERRIGFREKRLPGEDDGCAAMAARAARTALRRAGVPASDLQLVVYCGSEYKEHIVWNAASHVARTLGARDALSFEVYALCAGLPIALQVARDLMASRGWRRALVATASREGDLVDPVNPRTRWMANFGAGAGAIMLGRDGGRGVLAGFGGLTDSRLSTAVVQPAGGSTLPASERTVRERLHHLDVPDMDSMRELLAEVSLPNYLRTVRAALDEAGATVDDVCALLVTLMKPSFHDELVDALGLDPSRAVYLDRVGHMQSVDQIAALEIAAERGLLESGKVALMAAAGTGYTWSAMAIRWRR
jgi:3-oxoacyl-[acyl-carrier-protein] synthase-3